MAAAAGSAGGKTVQGETLERHPAYAEEQAALIRLTSKVKAAVRETLRAWIASPPEKLPESQTETTPAGNAVTTVYKSFEHAEITVTSLTAVKIYVAKRVQSQSTTDELDNDRFDANEQRSQFTIEISEKQPDAPPEACSSCEVM